MEPSDGTESLCLETDVLELDGITWAVGSVTNDRLGLKDSGPLEVEWSATREDGQVRFNQQVKTRQAQNAK